MKASMINIAVLALALGVTAAPSRTNRDLAARCDEDASSASEAVTAISATATIKANAKAPTTATEKAAAGTTTTKKATSKSTTAVDSNSDASASATTTAGSSKSTSDSNSDSGSDSSATTSKGSNASATSSKASKASGTSGSGGGASTTTTPTSGNGTVSSGGDLPASSGTSVLSAAQTIAAGASFDGGMVMFDRGVSCTGQAEGGDSDAVFQIEAGGSLSNVIIGPNQIEGVHCQGACTLTNVWWSAVCEDAFTIKNQEATETSTITGGGAFGASDKVLQHNGAGTLSVSGFTVGDFGKLYRSCGNCKTSFERHVIMDGITATTGDILAGINSNFGDTATITNTKASGVKEICTRFEGVASGSEPSEIGSGADGTSCIFGSDVVST